MAKEKSKTENQKKAKTNTFVGTYEVGLYQAFAPEVPAKETGKPTWTSDNPELARPNGNGLVSSLKPGRAVVTAAYPSGSVYTWAVNVANDESQPPLRFVPAAEGESPEPAPAPEQEAATVPEPTQEAATVPEPTPEPAPGRDLRSSVPVPDLDLAALQLPKDAIGKKVGPERFRTDDQPRVLQGGMPGITQTVQAQGLAAAARTLEMEEEDLRFQFHKEQLLQLPGATEALAHYCALAGLRVPADLAGFDPDKLFDVFQALGRDPDRVFPPPNLEEIRGAILEAEEFEKPALLIPDDLLEPSGGLGEAADEGFPGLNIGKLLRDGLDVLSKLNSKPPLPRILCGTVELQWFDAADQAKTKPLIGAMVEVSGIASPAQDKVENNEDLHCFTGGEGDFSIVMPDRYNMQETVTFKVSENPDAPEIRQRKMYLGGMGARSVTFTRRASEIMKAARVVLNVRQTEDGSRPSRDGVPLMDVYDRINRLQVLKQENEALRRKLQRQADDWVLEEEKRAKRADLLKRKAEAEETRRQALTAIIEAIRAYLPKLEAEELRLRELMGDQPVRRPVQRPVQRPILRPVGTITLDPQKYVFNTAHPLPNLTDIKDSVMEQNAAFEALQGQLHQTVTEGETGDRDEAAREPNADDRRLALLHSLIAQLRAALDRCQERLDSLAAFLAAQLHRCEARLEDVGTSPLNFALGAREFQAMPDFDRLMASVGRTGRTRLDQLVSQEDSYLLSDSDGYPGEIPIGSLRTKAMQAKRELTLVVAELNALPPDRIFPHEQTAAPSSLDQYLALVVPDYKPQPPAVSTDAQTYVDNLQRIREAMEALGCKTDGDLADLISRLLTAELYADMGTLTVLEDAFTETSAKPAALPSVRLMGEGKNATFLPTDTAPSRVFSYGMIQRLVEPEIRCFDENGNPTDRRKGIQDPLDVGRFKRDFYADPDKAAIARSLGMGYLLNMHQAWVPDGFALGSLLYSLVLAPGEEQRILIKEHSESYTVDDQASAEDSIRDTYANRQEDNEEAAFSNAADRFSAAHSDYSYYSKAKSKGASGLGLCFGLIAGSSSTSTNSGNGASNASQSDSYNEVSQAAQSFQTDIKTESERIAKAKRASIRVASSSDSESVASKIIANHNHSHVMTVQYWEVMRRYRMETCIEGIDLVLFVPLKPVAFLPGAEENDRADTEPSDVYTWSQLQLSNAAADQMCVGNFIFRYSPILRYADDLLPALPPAYRPGLETMKKFAAYPDWEYFSSGTMDRRRITLTLEGNILECDELSAALIFSTGRSPLRGRVVSQNRIHIHESMNTRKDVLYFLEKARQGKYVIKYNSRMEGDAYYGPFLVKYRSATATTDRYLELDLKNGSFADTAMAELLKLQLRGRVKFEFTLPADVSELDIASIRVENRTTGFTFRLSQDTRYMEAFEEAAIKNYEEALYNYTKDNSYNGKDRDKISHYSERLPECYTNAQITLTPAELRAAGSLELRVRAVAPKSRGKEYEAGQDSAGKENLVNEDLILDGTTAYVDVVQPRPVMHLSDVEQMEKTLRHVAARTIHYSQVIWSSLTDDERIILLEPYTVDMDFSLSDAFAKEETKTDSAKEDPIPLLNCVNPQRVLGFYGNCMLLPFTYPQRLAKVLGKTAGEIQNELYRYHTTAFRVPSTVISVPTDGMVGEAVLGATNVSEKVDLTRFWNWKDSDIDHMSIDQSSFRGNSSLLEKAETMRVDAPTQGVTPTAHIDGSGLAASLLGRAPAQFADVLANTDIRQLLQSTDSNASAGREAVVKANSGMINTAVQAAADVAKAYFGAKSGNNQTGGGNNGSGNSNGNGNGNGGGTGNNDGGGTGGSDSPPTGNPKPPASDVDSPAPAPEDPAPNPDNSAPSPDNPAPSPDNPAPSPDNPAPDAQEAPAQTGGGTRIDAVPADENERRLLELLDQALAAMSAGQDAQSFYSQASGRTDAQAAREEMETLSAQILRENGVDLQGIVTEAMQE